MKSGKLKWLASMAATITITAAPAAAQEVWVYQAVSPNNAITTYGVPPEDISYPADGSAAQIISEDTSSHPAILLTPEEEAHRLESPQIIIDAVPSSLARNLSFPSALPANAPPLH